MLLLLVFGGWPAAPAAQPTLESLQQAPAEPSRGFLADQLQIFREAVISLPIAALLGAMLAFRPRQRGTPPRKPPVIQTQIILAIVGAVVMLVVGASLARAFGIVGAASLIRYRAKIDDPKDAGVMLSTLGIGLASGVGAYFLATFATVFIMLVLWIVESIEPQGVKRFDLKVTTKDLTRVKTEVEKLLRRNDLAFELRSSSNDEVCYEVKLPLDKQTGRLTNAILRLDPTNETAVEWGPKKDKG